MTCKAFTANYLPTTHHKCRSNFFFLLTFTNFHQYFFCSHFMFHYSSTHGMCSDPLPLYESTQKKIYVYFYFIQRTTETKCFSELLTTQCQSSLLCLVRGLWKFVDEVTCEQHWLTTCCQILYGWLFMLNLSFQCYSLTEYKYSPGHFIHLMLINKSFILLYCLWF